MSLFFGHRSRKQQGAAFLDDCMDKALSIWKLRPLNPFDPDEEQFCAVASKSVEMFAASNSAASGSQCAGMQSSGDSRTNSRSLLSLRCRNLGPVRNLWGAAAGVVHSTPAVLCDWPDPIWLGRRTGIPSVQDRTSPEDSADFRPERQIFGRSRPDQ